MRNFVLISILETMKQNKNVKVFMINIYYRNKAKQSLPLKLMRFIYTMYGMDTIGSFKFWLEKLLLSSFSPLLSSSMSLSMLIR